MDAKTYVSCVVFDLQSDIDRENPLPRRAERTLRRPYGFYFEEVDLRQQMHLVDGQLRFEAAKRRDRLKTHHGLGAVPKRGMR
jgi:hypothetical protein